MSNNSNTSHSACHCIGLAFGALLLRLWIGMRLLFAGLEKWKTKVSVTNEETGETATYWVYKVFGEGSGAIYNENMGRITSAMNNDSPLQLWMIEQFASTLGWMLLIIGVWVLIGLFSRASLTAAGFVFISLTFGLATIGADPEIVERGIEIGLVVGALSLARYQVFGVDGLIRLAMGKGGDSDDDSSSKRSKD
ncbi:MAG: thiosulfate dehydrogenase [quinone] large subunit [Verrucomicrobiales bacterium]|jgi:thiosulfate dehydrogenase [quinone] large subunit